ncbi:MAG: MBL fold metallo-hydrolase [Deltaproteobacteria bacterium]|nr:MBL fold metallo-hydrolase [Deltaproteobacteria bacterium]
MDIVFLGTGGAWSVPEINCDCFICREMRSKGEKRERTSLLLSGETTLLIDCGPDAGSQLRRHDVTRIDGVLISHEHGDHFIGLDELFAYKRNVPREDFIPIPVYMTQKSWEVIGPRFEYLVAMEVIEVRKVAPGTWFRQGEFRIFPFQTQHGDFSKGAVGFVIKVRNPSGKEVRILYTSDFVDLPEVSPELLEPDYLIMQSFWLNEPRENRPHHMSFQRAIPYIEQLRPKKETFLVHIGDADMVLGDPANKNAKKCEPKDPLKPPSGGDPYPIPLNQEEWQKTIDHIMADRNLPFNITVAYDDLKIRI